MTIATFEHGTHGILYGMRWICTFVFFPKVLQLKKTPQDLKSLPCPLVSDKKVDAKTQRVFFRGYVFFPSLRFQWMSMFWPDEV